MLRSGTLIASAVLVLAAATAAPVGAGAAQGAARTASVHPKLARSDGGRCRSRWKRHRAPRCHRRHRVSRSESEVAAPAPSPPVPAPTPSPLDTTPPKFAGLESALACTPGPQSPGETTPFHLSWEAASDDVTPPGLILYDIYLATALGGEDFSHPTWTTPPGVTSYETPGLPSHGSFYFVVRARDRAGNEDTNKLEVHGSDPCV